MTEAVAVPGAINAPDSESRQGADSSCIEVERISAWFRDVAAVKEISTTFRDRSVTAIIGPSGCGKSTLLRCLNRMHETVPGARVEGSVRVFGTEIYDGHFSATTLRRHIGMVFQRPTPFPTMSIRNNVAAGLAVAGRTDIVEGTTAEIVEEALKRAALWDEVKDRLDKSAMALSGGQQQRLCIARALATRPRVLLLDEPTASLDPLSTQRIEELVYHLRSSIGVVIVTHNMQQAARVSDRTTFLLDGELVESGDTKTLFTAPADRRTEDYITGRFG